MYGSIVYVAFISLLYCLSLPVASAAPNLVPNGDFEVVSSSASIPQHWTSNYWGSLRATFTYPVTGNPGKAAKVTVSNRTSGDAKWVSPEVPAAPGEKYIYSNTYLSSIQTEVTVQFKMSNGSYKYVWLGSVPASSNWKTYSGTLTVPSGAVAFTVFHLINRNGSLSIDNVSVTNSASTPPPPPTPTPVPTCTLTATPDTIEKGQQSVLTWTTQYASSTSIDNGVIATATTSGSANVSPSSTTLYTLHATGAGGTVQCTKTVTVTDPVPPPPPPTNNLINNGDLETASSNASLPVGWNTNYWGSLRATFSYPSTGASGGKAAKVTVANYQSGDAKWWFTHIPASSNTLYRYTNTYTATAPSNITVEFKMQDGSHQYMWLSDAPAQSSWTPFTAQITVPAGAVSFTVFHSLARNGSLTIDNVSVTALSQSSFAEPMVSFVFDDALASQYSNARSILNTAGFKGVFSVITQFAGSAPYMTWNNLTTLKNEGHEVNSHTRTHADLTTLAAASLQSEIQGSYDDLIARGFAPKTLVYPYGGTSPAVKQVVQDAGYLGARGSYYGFNAPVTDRYALYDIRLDKTSTLSGTKAVIDQVIANKRWLVFELHDILPSGGDEYTITPTLLQSIVSYLKEKGVKVVTLEEGVGLMTP